MPPPEKPRPRPKPPKPVPKLKTGPEVKPMPGGSLPEPPKPKPKLKTGPVVKPMPVRTSPEPERDGTPAGGGLPLLHQPFSCATYGRCPPPPAPPATVHLRSGRLPTPLIGLSASLLAVSAVLLLALLVRWLLRRRRRRGQEALPPLAQDDEESVLGVVDEMTAGAVGGEEEEVDSGDDGGVHHVWYIRTKGLDERAIAAIAAVVYDARKKRGADGDGGCAVCLAEFRDGETLRLLPRCGHAFHRGCIDPWLRAHVNCPLCRAPVQVAAAAKGPGTATPRPRGEEASAASLGGARTRTEDSASRRVLPDHAVRRAASMMTLPRRAWPDVSVQAPASNSGRDEDMTGLAKIRRLLKFSEALDMAGIGAGRSVSFGAGSLPTRSGPSTAAGVNGEEIECSR